MTANTCWNKNPFVSAASCAVTPAPQPPSEEELIRSHAEHFKHIIANNRLDSGLMPILTGELVGYMHRIDTSYKDVRFLASLNSMFDSTLMKMPFGFDVDSWYMLKKSGRYGSVTTWERYHREWDSETKKIIDELVELARQAIRAEREKILNAHYRKF